MSFLYSQTTHQRHPELFSKDERIDRRKCKRVVPMEALALGFARTGTASMRAALEALDIPTYHMYRLFNNRRDHEMWDEAFESKYYGGKTKLDRAFWDQLLGHVGSVTDFPAIAFGEELIAAYPEAKVILWERDEDAWYPSFEKASIEPYGNVVLWTMAKLDPEHSGKGFNMVERGVYGGFFGAKSADELRRKARPKYREHFQRIRSLMASQPERLLEYKLGDGWEPICELLGKEVPSEPFPRINDGDSQAEMVGIIFVQLAERLLWKIATVLFPVVLAIVLWKNQQRTEVE